MALPEEVKELVLGMLQYEPDLRSTMKQVLQHPWLASTASVKDVAMQDVARSAAQVGSGLLTSCLGTALSRACLAAPPPPTCECASTCPSFRLQRPSSIQSSAQEFSVALECTGGIRSPSLCRSHLPCQALPVPVHTSFFSPPC